jgi:putative secretion ATPase (PEP-CTERM system associated)
MYSEHYGLNGNPFQLTPDPRFWFESETHKKAMAYLGYGLAQSEGFIVITGDIGAGKTTLVGHLLATIDTTRLTAVQLVSTQVDGDDVLRLTAQQFGLKTEGVAKAQLLDRVEQFLIDQTRNGKRTLLIVDEAQNLSNSALEELRMLSNFQAAGRALLQIFLLGQPEFRDRVQHAANLEQMRQRIIATHHLQPMQADEIEPYIVHRLTVAGWQGTPQFAVDAYAALYAATDGVPRRLNTLMARILLFGAVEDLKIIDGQAVTAVVDDLASEDGETAAPHPVAVSVTSDTENMVSTIVEPTELDPVVTDPESFAALSSERHIEMVGERKNKDMALVTEEDGDLLDLLGSEVQDRIAALEARVEEQEGALRRCLTLLVQWVEEDEARPNLDVVQGGAA